MSTDQINFDCATEPIQIPGSVQPHGLLISLRATDFTILQISKNVFDILGVEASELLHQPLSQLMDVDPVRQSVKRLGERVPRLLNPIPIELSVNGRKKYFDGILHRSGRVINLELEPHQGLAEAGFGGFYETVRDIASRLFAANDVQEVSEIACDEIRKLTGFDRVMMYKFDEDWNGTVIAESLNNGVEGYLHHRFPASDIPKQARELYTVNWLRLIPDVNYTPSPLVPQINPLTDRPLDLSNSVLRSVSPVHVEYMKNMGLGASMSVSILKGRQLWGLISCHHLKPIFPRYDVRVACEFLGQMLSGQIESREQTADFDHKLQLKTIYTHLLSEGGASEDLTAALEKNATALLALTESQGAAICLRDGCTLVGRTPSREQVSALIHWLAGRDAIITDCLSAQYEPAKAFKDVASGLLAISIHGVGWVLWFRPEQQNAITWGGNPEEAKIWSESETRFRPRKSFESWVQKVDGVSKKWARPETDVALEFKQAATGLSSRTAPRHPSNASHPFAATAVPVTAPAPASASNNASSSKLEGSNALDLIEGFSDLSLALIDSEGIVRSWSSGAARMLGYAKREVVGKHFSVLLPEADAVKDQGMELLKRAKNEARVNEELWLYRKNGSSFWAKIGLNHSPSLPGVLASYSLIIEDFTNEKAAEEELKATKVAAEAANRTKSAFLANISHEIRTPLGAVLGFAELMSAENSEPQRFELYERVKRNGQQLSALINDLLDMSKAEAGRLEIELIDFDFATLINDIEQTFLPLAGEKRISLKFEVANDTPKALRSDPTRIRQILINLLSNALKFTAQHGSVTVSIQANATDKQLELRVTDSGRGMTDEEQSRLFQPFAQADVSMTRKFGGTGLGLFVSRRLARALGGDMKIEYSELGKGTTFLATIDISQLPAEISPIPKPQMQANANKAALKNMRLLLVDDSVDNRELISIFLKGAGATVVTAENGQAGVDRVEKDQFDVVLMDIQMPVMDGQQAMRELKMRGYAKPVIALTAHAMKEERENSLALGFSGYLTKPVNRAELISTIEAFRK